jgi:serine/threonine protein phosphatase 1
VADRIRVFGDIHGCLDEWRDLLEKVGPAKGDILVSVGDMVGKGPSSKGVLALARSLPGFKAVRGNHEERWLRLAQGSPSETLPAEMQAFGADLLPVLSDMATWPFFLSYGELAVVHAGLRPGKPLELQTARDLLELKELEDGKAWHALYKGPPKVVFGHWPHRKPVSKRWAVGLDTGCVYGGRLSVYLWPEDSIVSVPARKIYAVKKGPWR